MNDKLISYHLNGSHYTFDPQELDQYEKLNIYLDLSKCKNYAISKSYQHYYNLPIEKEDLESIAWEAFDETLVKYIPQKGNKSFESFLIDAITWRCSDYCEKYITNHHKVLNIATTYLYAEDKILHDVELFSNEIAWESGVDQYLSQLEDEEKKLVATTIVLGNGTIAEVVRTTNLSKSKVYRLSREVVDEISMLVL